MSGELGLPVVGGRPVGGARARSARSATTARSSKGSSPDHHGLRRTGSAAQARQVAHRGASSIIGDGGDARPGRARVAEAARRLGVGSPGRRRPRRPRVGSGRRRALLRARARAHARPPAQRRDGPLRRHPVLHPLVRGAVDASPGRRRDPRPAPRRPRPRRAGAPADGRLHVDATPRASSSAAYGILVRRRVVPRRRARGAHAGARREARRAPHRAALGPPRGRADAEVVGPWRGRAPRTAAAPDLAVVTGDMVTSGTDFHEDIAEAVGALRGEARASSCRWATTTTSAKGSR